MKMDLLTPESYDIKKEQGTYIYIPCSVRDIFSYAIAK